MTLSNLGTIARDRGQLEEAQDYYAQSLAIAQETHHAELEDAARDYLVEIASLQRRHEASES